MGNVEAHDLFAYNADVVVCDGFMGNVLLKWSESLADALASMLRENLRKTAARKVGAMLARNAYRELKRLSDADEYGGAPLLGVKGVCIIGHGASSPTAIKNAIRVAAEFVRHQANEHIVAHVRDLGLAPGEASAAGQDA